MGTPSTSLYLSRNPLNIHSNFRHFNKHLQCTPPFSVTYPTTTVKLSTFSPLKLNSANLRHTHLLKPVKSSITDSPSSNFENFPYFLAEKVRSFSDSVKEGLSDLNAFRVCKLLVIGGIVVNALNWVVSLIVNPFAWMYFSWTWLFWPWFVAIGVGVFGIYSFRKHSRGESSIIEQLGIVTSVFTWLTLVPPGFFNGFLEGWPFVFFLVYHYFFFFNVTIRKRLYGDYNARPHDPKWDISVPDWYRVIFGVGVMIGHWLAAFEGPELQLIPGGWSNFGIWGLIMVTLFTHYYASLYLANYSEKIVVPTAVVQFGPYRWVRHPIYASTMMLFLSYFVALRAPLSCAYIVAVCIMYYDQKAKVEEVLMVETFGEGYPEYASKVRMPYLAIFPGTLCYCGLVAIFCTMMKICLFYYCELGNHLSLPWWSECPQFHIRPSSDTVMWATVLASLWLSLVVVFVLLALAA